MEKEESLDHAAGIATGIGVVAVGVGRGTAIENRRLGRKWG